VATPESKVASDAAAASTTTRLRLVLVVDTW
jgi:hypothetical protein